MGFFGGHNGDLRFDLFPVLFCKQTLNRLQLSTFLTLSYMLFSYLIDLSVIFSLCHFHVSPFSFTQAHSNTHKTLHNDNISLKTPEDRLLHEICMQPSGDKHGEHQLNPIRWMSDTSQGHCPLYNCHLHLSSPFLSHLYIPLLSSLLFTCHLTSVTGCSDIDNSVFENPLNVCVYGPCLSVLPFPCNSTLILPLRTVVNIFLLQGGCWMYFGFMSDRLSYRLGLVLRPPL